MRKGSLLYLVFTMIFVITTVGSSPISFAADEARIYVNPSATYGTVGESFTVDIKIADVEDLYGWQINMTFNPVVVEFVNVTEGEFLMDQPEGTSGDSRIENEAGWAVFSWLTIGKHLGESGSGILATVEFLILSKGESLLNITNPETYLLEMIPPPAPPGSPPTQLIPSVTENGFFSSLITPPVTEFTWSPKRPSKNESVAFDASASYDDEEIVSYEWDFGDGTTEVYMGANLTATTTHEYATSGTKEVALNITDNTGLWSVKTADVFVRYVHDVAIPLGGVSVSLTEVEVGETISIEAKVTNLGEEAESFDVTVYYDGTAIDTQTVTGLEPDANETKTFSWDTAEVAAGDYAISVEADLGSDENTGDNVRSGGTVTVNTGQPFPTTLVIAVVVIVVVVGVGAFLLMRRRGAPPT